MTAAQTVTRPYLDVEDLRVSFRTDDGVVKAVDGLSFSLERGRTLGIVGESGSGKTVTGLSLLGLHDARRTEVSGHIWLEGTDLLALSDKQLDEMRGKDVAMVFQDALSALSPYYTVGNQIAEGFRRHEGGSKKAAHQRAIDLLGRVGIPQPDRRVDNYPHEFSGGMRQRAMIAMALACNPALLVADEPTTALDVTVQAQILDLMSDLQSEFNSAIIMVTHDLGVISEFADDVLVMYAGRCVERGDIRQVLSRPQMPYTWGLLSSAPRLTGDVDAPLKPVRGTPPSVMNLPPGCPFEPRCDHAWRVEGDRCRTERPVLRSAGPGKGELACHLDEKTRDAVVEEELLPLWKAS